MKRRTVFGVVFLLLLCTAVPQFSFAAEAVFVDEIGLTLSVPDGYAWVTRSKGDPAPFAATYKTASDRFGEYLENMGYYLMLLETNGNNRMSVQRIKADSSYKNYAEYSQEELAAFAADMGDIEQAETVYDTWVGGPSEFPFVCVSYSMRVGNDSYPFILGMTCFDGYWYDFIFRGASLREVMKLSDAILETVEFRSNTGIVRMDSADITFACPEGWAEVDRTVTKDPNLGLSAETVSLAIYHSPTSFSYIGVSVTDVAGAFGFDSAEMRAMVDEMYGGYMTVADLAANGIEATDVSHVLLHDVQFTRFKNKHDELSTLQYMGVKGGCMIMIQFVSTGDDVDNDICYPTFVSWLETLQLPK